MNAPSRWFVLVTVTLPSVFGSFAASGLSAQDNPHGILPEDLDCSACHTNRGWIPTRSPLQFVHGANSGFELTGSHRNASCVSCHRELRFDDPVVDAADCGSCHRDVHEARLAATCSSCHDTSAFDNVDGDRIHDQTSFPLTGAHRQVTCESCHTTDLSGAYTPLETECASCHLGEYEGAQTVDHVQNDYPLDCTECHTTVSWSDAPAFDHAAVAGGFELLGAHAGLRCASCHVVPGLELLYFPDGPQDCVACHQADYDEQHGGSGFPLTCADCHNVQSWDEANFDHGITAFPLLGAHISATCESCHGPPVDRAADVTSPDDCVACHRADYDEQHGGSGFPLTCADCHNVQSWEGASFDHEITAFPLLGAHVSATCESCHGPPVDLTADVTSADDCVACHQADYDEVHTGSGFPLTCAGCHDAQSWTGASVDHAQLSGFALTGPHAALSCTSCHAVPGYQLLFPQPADESDCVSCHQAEYDAQHGGSGFPTTCLTCHAPDTWTGATVDHASLAGGFALLGQHAIADCSACHAIPGYQLLFPPPADENDCVACHQSQYDAAHGGSGFPATCADCHGVDAWTPSTFDHDAQYFPIYSGAHSGQWDTCATCHIQAGDFGAFSCLECHRHNQADTDAHHGQVQGYVYSSTACLSCHPDGRH